MTNSLITVSLVTYNGMRWLPGCLASLEQQTLPDFELLVLDNASSDGSLEWLQRQAERLPWMRVEASSTNLGFAAGHNRNIYAAKGEFVSLLNQDIELDARFLDEAAKAFEGRPRVGAVQGRLLRLTPDGGQSDTIDSTGLKMFRSRRVVARGQGARDGARWSVPGAVWGVDGPAPVYRRAALDDVREPRTGGGTEVLDEDFFMYKEDVDLAWRLRRSGWLSWYQPSAQAWHGRTAGVGGSASLLDVARSNLHIDPWIKAVSWRNQRLMQLKNESLLELVPDLPYVVGREIASLGIIALAGRGRLRILRGLAQRVPGALAKRQRAPASQR